jgi:hypothetical protein
MPDPGGDVDDAVSPVRFRAACQRSTAIPCQRTKVYLRIIGDVTPGQGHQPAGHPDHGQADETDEHERRA